jgi:uncharacterized membrane protein YfcA
MVLGLPLPLLLAMLGIGYCAGILAGLLGIGGGMVIVPALFYLLQSQNVEAGLAMQMAVATSLATICLTAISSVRSHAKRGAVDVSILRAWALPVIIGAGLGSIVAAAVGGAVLAMVFAVVALLVAAQIGLNRQAFTLGEKAPTSGWLKSVLAGGIGFISSLMGIGGGIMSVSAMVLYNTPIRTAVGTASAIGLILAVPSTIGFMALGQGVDGRPAFSLGYVSLFGFVLIAPLSMLGAPLGAKIAHTISSLWLKRCFSVALVFVAIRMLSEAFRM